MTRSIVQRLNPQNVFGPVQYLHRDTALFAQDEWVWTNERRDTYVFDTNLEAEVWVKDHGDHFTYVFVLSLGDELLQARRHRQADRDAQLDAAVAEEEERRRPKSIPERIAEARRRKRLKQSRVSPVETFQALEKRGLA